MAAPLAQCVPVLQSLFPPLASSLSKGHALLGSPQIQSPEQLHPGPVDATVLAVGAGISGAEVGGPQRADVCWPRRQRDGCHTVTALLSHRQGEAAKMDIAAGCPWSLCLSDLGCD